MNTGKEIDYIKQEELLSEIEMLERSLRGYEKAVYENVGQVLSLARMDLFTINLEKKEEAQKKINDSRQLIGKAIYDLRFMTKQIKPGDIIQHGFTEGIKDELQRICELTGCEASLSVNGPVFKLDEERNIIIFTIVQEIMQDLLLPLVSKITISINYLPNIIELKIIYPDNDQVAGSKNLISGNVKLYHRLQLINATLTIESFQEDKVIAVTIKK